MSRSLRRRSEEITQSNTFHGCEKYLLSPRGVRAIEVLQNEEILGQGTNGGQKGVSSAICQKKSE